MTKKTLIISDLHVGAGPLDDCDDELENKLVSFIDEVCISHEPVELVINGDFLDFAQAPPWSGSDLESVSPLGIPLCFTEDQSVAKLEAIANQHGSVFAGLTRLLAANPNNKLVINPGNHDADFFWPNVRGRFLEIIAGDGGAEASQLSFNLTQFYKCGNVWIEHGNNYDPANWFYVHEYDPTAGHKTGSSLYWQETKPPILRDRKGTQRLYECLGTRFMIQFLNSLDAQYPFVDNVKPFKKFLKVFGASALVRGYGPIKATLAVWRMLGYLGANVVTDPTGLLEIEAAPRTDPAARLLIEKLKTLSVNQTRDFHQAIRAGGFNLERPAVSYLHDPELCAALLTFLSDNLDLLEAFFPENSSYLSSESGATDGYLTLAKQFNSDETKKLKDAARTLLHKQEIDLVVMGHTHEPVRDAENGYFNTGSWTRNYDLDTNRLRSWDILRSGSEKYFPYELNYVEISDYAPPRMETYARTI